MGHRVQIAYIASGTRPVFTTLARVKECTFWLLVLDLAHIFRAAEFLAENTLGGAGVFMCNCIGGPARAIARAFPPFPALARIKKRALGF